MDTVDLEVFDDDYVPIHNGRRRYELIEKVSSVMGETGIEYAEHYCNPLRHCGFLCLYPCYALNQTRQFKRIAPADEGGNADWVTPRYIGNYMELIEKYIPKIDTGERVFLSSMTDIYGADVEDMGIARNVTTRFNEGGVEYILLTKSTKFLRDLDVFADSKVGKLGVSITTNIENDATRKKFELRTPSISERLDALKKASEYGDIDLWVSAEPFLPNTDFEKYFQQIIDYTGGNLSELMLGKENYNSEMDEKFEWANIAPVIRDFDLKHPDIQFHYKKQFVRFLESELPEMTPENGYPNQKYHQKWQ